MDRRLGIAFANDAVEDSGRGILNVIPAKAFVAAQFLIAEQVNAEGEGDEGYEDNEGETAHGEAIVNLGLVVQ